MICEFKCSEFSVISHIGTFPPACRPKPPASSLVAATSKLRLVFQLWSERAESGCRLEAVSGEAGGGSRGARMEAMGVRLRLTPPICGLQPPVFQVPVSFDPPPCGASRWNGSGICSPGSACPSSPRPPPIPMARRRACPYLVSFLPATLRETRCAAALSPIPRAAAR